VWAEGVLARARPVAATLIGKGGARDLGELARARAASLIIIGRPITPVQERNLERIASCRVLDRTGLILDIFAQRATSSEGKLQVELAQLRHLSTRLVRGWSHLERQKGGIGLRGPGETQLETDRRLICARSKALTRALRRVESQRMLRRRARRRAELPAVSLAGYTNAGKSSLFNRLCGAQVPAADRLFATLDPTMRRLELPGFGAAVLSDTVGFIRELPHALVAAFHSTLEEMASASCLLLVEDQADPERAEHRAAVERVLEEIGAGEVPRIRVYNKMDLAGGRARCRRGRDGRIDRVWLSAHSGDGIDLLRQALAELLGRRRRDYVLRLQPQAGALRARLYQRCDVIDEQIDAAGRIRLKLKMEAADRGWLEAQRQYQGMWSE
ncbi:MAG: GTPase HflX, partial [Gammaproteobacteria bacterium]|nr:GTPase HflX [Gammaproteobacteria bacterium]